MEGALDIAVALITLTSLEIVLGIDNIVLLAVITQRLPKDRRKTAMRVGLALAMLMRIGLLFAIAWVMKLTTPLFGIFGHDFSGEDLILLAGGLFLLGKATFEIHHHVEDAGEHEEHGPGAGRASFGAVIAQIVALDLVFSLDSVITAVGMVDDIWVMIVAVVIAIGIMMFAAHPISKFVERHPTFKLLALSFLVLIGVLLVADGFGQHLPRGYVYFAMGFSLVVELLNMRFRKNVRRIVQADMRRDGHPEPGVQQATVQPVEP